jgi:hypothetical protein
MLVVGVNSLVSLSDADTYLSSRIDTIEWTEAEEPLKEASLITATTLMNDLDWIGSARSLDQLLCFPREGEYYSRMYGDMLDYPITGCPPDISRAAIELAFHLLRNPGILDESASVDNLKVGPIELENVKPVERIPSSVMSKIMFHLKSNQPRTWYRSN